MKLFFVLLSIISLIGCASPAPEFYKNFSDGEIALSDAAKVRGSREINEARILKIRNWVVITSVNGKYVKYRDAVYLKPGIYNLGVKYSDVHGNKANSKMTLIASKGQSYEIEGKATENGLKVKFRIINHDL